MEATKTIELIARKDDMALMIRQPYAVTISRHQLDVHQMRVMLRIIQALQPSMKFEAEVADLEKLELEKLEKEESQDTVLEFAAVDLMPKGSRNHASLRKSLKGLTLKGMSFRKKVGKGFVEINTHLVQSTEYFSGDEIVKIKIDKQVLPFLLALSKNYTKYMAEVSFNASTPSIMKLYQYISQFRDKRIINVYATTLKELLGLSGKYALLDDFKRRVIKPAILELKEKADIWFDIADNLKKGRRVIGWRFNIYKKKSIKKLAKKEPKTFSEKLDEKQKRVFKLLQERFCLSRSQAQKVIQKVDKGPLFKTLTNFLQTTHFLIRDGKIHNIGGYTAKVLSDKLDIKL